MTTNAELIAQPLRIADKYGMCGADHQTMIALNARLAELSAENASYAILDSAQKELIAALRADRDALRSLLRVIQREVNKQGQVSEETATAIDNALNGLPEDAWSHEPSGPPKAVLVTAECGDVVVGATYAATSLQLGELTELPGENDS